MKIYALDRRIALYDFTDRNILRGLSAAKEYFFEASRHEYYIVPLIIDADYDMRELDVTVGALECVESGKIFDHSVTCFQAGGVGADGVKFARSPSLTRGVMQPIHIGLDFSKADIGNYFTIVKIGGEDIRLNFKLNDELVFNEGIENGNSQARLKWLNSTAYSDKKIVKCLEAVTAEKNSISLLGKKVQIGNDGFIENVESYFGASNSLKEEVQNELFYQPFDFFVEGQKFKYNKVKITSRTNSAVIAADGKSDKMRIDINANVMYEGLFEYAVKLTADEDVFVEDIGFNAYFKACKYFSGLGQEGGLLTADRAVSRKHDGKTSSTSVYIGDINCGARIALKGSSVRKSAAVYDRFADSADVEAMDLWGNFGKGGIGVTVNEYGAVLSATTGKDVIAKGESKTFYFTIHLTPFKPLNLKNSLVNAIGNDHIESSYGAMILRAANEGIKYLNITSNGELNSCVNYPFDNIRALKQLALSAHKNKIGLSISYSVGELSANAREATAFLSLGDELILREAGEARNPAVAEPMKGSPCAHDDTILTKGGSRIENYYAEGVGYLINKADLNAVCLTNPTVTRNGAERVAKCVTRKRSLDGMVELGFSDRYNEANGMSGALNEYADILPFVTKLYAENGDLSKSPDYVITELSGIIYGLTAAAPSESGICRSLLYGMLPKYGMDVDTSEAIADVVKVFTEFDIDKAELKGFWDDSNPVRVDNKEILCTSYINGGNMIAVLYNTSSSIKRFEVGVENKLGFTTVGKKMYKPKIEGVQKEKRATFNRTLKLRGHHGIVVVVKEKAKKGDKGRK